MLLVLSLIQLVNKKLQKGKPLSQIADEIEESTELVEKIFKAIESCATDDINQIYEALQKQS